MGAGDDECFLCGGCGCGCESDGDWGDGSEWGIGPPGEAVQGGELEAEGLGTEVMGGTGRSGML